MPSILRKNFHGKAEQCKKKKTRQSVSKKAIQVGKGEDLKQNWSQGALRMSVSKSMSSMGPNICGLKLNLRELDTLLCVPRQLLYCKALTILQLSYMFCIWSCKKFNQMDVFKLFYLWLHFLESINSLLLVCRLWAREMSQDRYINL